MPQQLFGTDGIRGRFGEEPITPLTILKLGWAIGTALRDRFPKGEVLIGKDTRVSGYLLETALTSGLSAACVDVCLLGPTPTPAVAHFCKNSDAIAGVVISASHNPFYDNGIKLIQFDGSKLDTPLERQIEQVMESPMVVGPSKNLGKVRRFDENIDQYAKYCESLINVRLDGLRVAIDCANGASYRIAPRVLQGLGANVHATAVEPDGFNINLDCGSTNRQNILAFTTATESDVGIALDGDGDRVIMADEHGNIVNGDQILYILAMAKQRSGTLNGGVVGTHLSNIGLDIALKKQAIPFVRVNVGDRYISECLNKKGWNLGGEESGHVLVNNSGVCGDGLITALEVLAEIKKTGQTLSQLASGVELVPQVTRNVVLSSLSSPLKEMDSQNWPNTELALQNAKDQLSKGGRVLLRPSGTEPVIRILVEGSNVQQIAEIADRLAAVVKEESSQFAVA